MNIRFKSKDAVGSRFSLARAIQQPALDIWRGKDVNAAAAEQALYYRAKCNRGARRGEYDAVLDQKMVAKIDQV